MRSLVNHIDELRVLLATSPIDVLTINETWLNSTINDNDVYIPGYEIIRRDRAFRSADGKTYGGVCFYVRSSVNFIQRKGMSIDDLENVCIQIQKPNSKPFLVATWYRPSLVPRRFGLFTCARGRHAREKNGKFVGKRLVEFAFKMAVSVLQVFCIIYIIIEMTLFTAKYGFVHCQYSLECNI